ncbi:putative HMP/thiamine import ATP-binding protein YkoD [Corynebacterium oculi]|uniref:Putative HMP/thiamine import ATP-binding protein YkoD n=2 Tax=Corynebacterium oculi TaxID=1544416 RepID=A0A0N8VZC5_9CORY|nr:ABC transporter ATP-binding protein [Corynebacterium oculi]KQB83514.1 putative HMP/thiamine import ATP-binding protein YkoD [Corynebacterium oculi]
MHSSRPVVHARGLTLTTEQTVLLDDVNLRVDPGEAVLITGRSGAGKSSLLRVLNGLVPHVYPGSLSGSVEVGGIDPATADLAVTGRIAATVFQNPRTQFFATDVLSEIALGASNAGLPREDILRRIDEAAERFELTGLLGRGMTELSGGERQRVALAAAVVSRPRLYLLDEPTANLDAASTRHFAEAVRDLRESGATLIIAEHRLHHLVGVVDRVVRMEGGRIVSDLPAEEFWAMPRAGLRSFEEPPENPLPPASLGGDGLTVENARFPRGAVTCVTGRNGAGKSTLLRMVVGLHKAKGKVRLDGKELSPRRRRAVCAAVMQDVNRQLFGESVEDELRLGLRGRRDFRALLASLGLAGLEDRHPLSLSGGQRQRLAVATARIAEAEVIVFDEPTSGLDLEAMEQMAEVIRSCAEQGAVVIVVTHDRELVDRVGDYELRVIPPQTPARSGAGG